MAVDLRSFQSVHDNYIVLVRVTDDRDPGFEDVTQLVFPTGKMLALPGAELSAILQERVDQVEREAMKRIAERRGRWRPSDR